MRPAVHAEVMLCRHTSDVFRKNKVTDNLVKIELDVDQGFMKACARFNDKKFEY